LQGGMHRITSSVISDDENKSITDSSIA
jgi:hypothetical protein